MPLWTPAEIAVAAWYDASDSATITLVGSKVSAIADKSGNSRHLSQGTDSLRPTVSTAYQNGLNVLTFDGADDRLRGSTGGTPIGAEKISVITVFKYGAYNTWCSGPVNMDYNALGKPIRRYNANITINSTTTTSALQLRDLSYIFRLYTAVVTKDAGGAGIHNFSEYLNTVFTTGTNNSGTWDLSNQSVSMGATYDGGGTLLGHVAETVILNGNQTTDTIQRIEGYLAHKWGLATLLPSGHPYRYTAPAVYLTKRSALRQLYQLEGSPRALLDQEYFILKSMLGLVDQPYGLRLLTALIQYYGDTPTVRRLLAQYYGSATLLRRILAEPYGDALAVRQAVDQEWILPAAMRGLLEHGYSLAGEELRALMAENYDISELNLLRAQLDQIYVMGAAGAMTQRPAITVTADGVAIDPHHINLEIDEGNFAIRGEIHLARQDEFLRCRHLWTEVVITIGADEYVLLVESPRRSRPGLGRADYIVPLISASILLDAPYAETITREFTGAMASAIVTELASRAGIAIDWQCVDWYLPAATVYANAETPLSVIRKIVGAVGGVIQTTPGGVLVCRPEYPVSVPAWASAAPEYFLTDMDNFFSVDSTPSIRDGFNRFLVSNQDAAAAGLTIEQVEIDATTKEIRVYQVPWNEASDIILRTSGGAWVSIDDENVAVETITDLVEIVGGEGQTTKPIHAMGSHAYKQAVLGAVTVAEDGHLTTEIKGNSLLAVVYSTRYHKFVVSDPRIEDVQFFPEEVAI